jgi:hypothetical protein
MQLPENAALPPRSLLFCLMPVGIGTPEVESMTGYVMRLAEAHLLSPKTLVTREILPLFQRSFLLDSQRNFLATFWTNNVPALNGTQTWAFDWVKVVEHLTLRSDLRFLTMLPWSQVIASKSLIRRTRAWCSRCYHEWWSHDQPLYEPLLWTLSCITVCREHHCAFDTVCPQCQRMQPLLGPESRLGYCAWCQGWLGSDVRGKQDSGEQLAENHIQRRIWEANVLGELLAAAPSITAPLEKSLIATKLAIYLAPLIQQGKLRLGHSPLRRDIIHALRQGDRTPQLDTLLTLCFWFSTSPLRFFTEDIEPTSLEYREVCRQEEQDRMPRKQRGPAELEQLRKELEKFVADPTEPPLSLSAVARLLQCHYPFLLHRFPEQSNAITTRFRAYIRTRSLQRQEAVSQEIHQIVRSLHSAGVYPSTQRVAEHMRHPKTIQYHEGMIAYRQALRDLDLE